MEPESGEQDVSVSDLLNPQTETAPTESTEPTDAQVQEGQQETSAPSLKDRAAELGFADVTDDSEAAERLISAFRQNQEREQEARQQIEAMRFQLQMMQQGQPQQQTQAQQPQQAQTAQSWFNAPKANEQFRQQFIAGKNEDGTVQWKPNTPPSVMSEYEAEQAFYADWAQRLVRDPVSALAGFKEEILAEAERKAQEFYAAQAQRQQAETYVQQQIREHEDVFYQKDPVTKQIRYDYQGRPMLTEAGVRFESILGDLERSGIADETARWRYAQQSYKAQYGDLKQQASDKIAQARAGHAAKTAAATHIAQRNGQTPVTNGRRQESEGLGSRMFANPEFASGIRF